MNKTLKTILEYTVYLVIIVGIAYFTPKIMSKILGTDYPMAAITSGSMWPALKEGDLIFIKHINREDIKIDDVIIYQNPKGFTIHRVVKLNEDTLITKGDANTVKDSPIGYDKVIGKLLTFRNNKPIRIPLLGKITILAQRK